MPDSNLSAAIKEAYAVARNNDPALDTLEIYHPNFDNGSGGNSVYIIRNKEEFTADLEDTTTVTFEPVPFRMERPSQGETGFQEIAVAIDNTDRRITDFVNAVKFSQAEAKLRYRPYLASDTSGPQVTAAIELTIAEISMNEMEVVAKARFVDVLNRPFPNQNFTRARFPSLGG